MILLNLTLGSSNYSSRRAPYHSWSPTAPEDFEDTLRSVPRPLCPLPFQFPTTDISIWITTYTCCSYNYSEFLLLLQDASNCSPTLKNPLNHCLVVPCRRNIHTDNSSHLSSICSSPVVHILHKILWNTIRSSENPLQTIARQLLVCLHYGCFSYV